ncbi:MAG: methionyl-tRNA formyltransferase [Bacteroidales bacterium]|nr:methionyl-tRNA formyltransferase [Bacteroidales bacterium]
MTAPRIIFMGTPEFAVPSLGALLMNNYNVVAVVSAPDRPAGRGLKRQRPAVATYAADNYLKLLQPDNLSDQTFVETITELSPDIIVVVAFRKLPEEIWRIPGKGTFNLHASLLPQYRGAAPINHAIINGEKVTGLTTFMIDDNIDTGNIIFRKKVRIAAEDSAGNLHDKLMREGAKLVVKTVKALTTGNVKLIDQRSLVKNDEKLNKAPRIYSNDCYINWEQTDREVYNFIRGLYPYPGARTILRKDNRDYIIKIGRCKCAARESGLNPGEILSNGKDYLMVGTSGKPLIIEEIQIEGKKKMPVPQFLRGFNIKQSNIIKDLPV